MTARDIIECFRKHIEEKLTYNNDELLDFLKKELLKKLAPKIETEDTKYDKFICGYEEGINQARAEDIKVIEEFFK